ncbi:MAG: hypothetical protein L3J84_02655 [Gammaproteobacteria bacterium]|nr:hypothetical protein [Gammaproteobacteria bacterium]
MCGIVGAVADRDVAPILVEGLRRLECRGYDSEGVALLDGTSKLDRVRSSSMGKLLVRCVSTIYLQNLSETLYRSKK